MSPLTNKFVEVPISVMVPPRMEAYESGISTFEGWILFSIAHFCRKGRKRVTNGVLLMKAEAVLTGTMIRNNAPGTVLLLLRNLPAASCISPLFETAAPAINKRATVWTLVLEKPDKASPAGRMPLTIKRARVEKTVISAGSHSLTRTKNMMASNTQRTAAEKGIGNSP
ncbi:hypothetical protein B14911_11842 [Bacillus sp. NRRL B-14911]|nr:hypothetical protein B14911_11842 [Bacillus sp. NRRL B-14911]